jgi:hypothetical protein
MPVEQQEIHITKASGVASALGWWAKYHKIGDEENQMCRQLACWMLFQTRATKVEVPNTPAIPVVMGMIAQEGQLGLVHAPAVPGWAFQGYINDEEHDNFIDEQREKTRVH